jgi:hypothetical protein
MKLACAAILVHFFIMYQYHSLRINRIVSFCPSRVKGDPFEKAYKFQISTRVLHRVEYEVVG